MLSAAAAPLARGGAEFAPAFKVGDLPRRYLMMRGALDDRVVIGHLAGQYHALVDERTTPLFGVVSATFSRYRRMPGGGWQVASFEQAYYTDPASGEVLYEFRNPFNGKVGPVPVWRSTPILQTVTPSLAFMPTEAVRAGVTVDQGVISAAERGGELIVVERVRARAQPADPSARPFNYTDFVTSRADLDAFGDASAVRVPCRTQFEAVCSWRAWLQMGNLPGHLMAYGSGRYGTPLEALPPVWLTATQRHRPELLESPAALLQPLWEQLPAR